jgi:hypothetical protein
MSNIEERLAKAYQPNCRQCNAAVGEEHDWCSIARCKTTGQQLIQCPGEEHEYKGRIYGEHEGECGPNRYDGYWAGYREAIERGWYSKLVPGQGWQRTTADDPEGSPDLNRVAIELEWSPELQRMVDPSD